MIGYPSGQDGGILPARDYPPRPARKIRQKPYNKSFIDQVCSVKMAGYWPRSFFREFIDLDCVSVHKHAKENLANIQPSWPHTWSITHTRSHNRGAIFCLLFDRRISKRNNIYLRVSLALNKVVKEIEMILPINEIFISVKFYTSWVKR